MLKDKKLSSDILFNLISLAIVGALGIALNIIIAKLRGPEPLGLFNQVFAAYILCAQLGAFGIQHSVFKGVAEAPQNAHTIFWHGLVVVFVTAIAATSIYCAIAFPASWILKSVNFKTGIFFSAPALFFFSLNKVLLATFNGIRSMKSFAIYNSLRYILLVLSILYLILNNFSSSQLLLSLSITEFFLFSAMLIHLQFLGFFSRRELVNKRIRDHFYFGFKSFPGGLITELNTKVDILMLGVFLSDKAVGVYSFAAVLAEGISQVLVVIRNNCNPIIAKEIAEQNWNTLKDFIKKMKTNTFIFFSAISLVAIAFYPLSLKILSIKDDFSESYIIFSILITGLIIHAPFAPTLQILQLGGFPGYQTLFFLAIVCLNIVANAIFIPLFGLKGAALATSLAIISSNFLIKAFIKNFFKRPLV